MELQERILFTADELFRKYGVRSITMDDLAKHLSISKKTLYQYYTDKDELVHKITGDTLRRVDRDMESIREEAKDAIDECVRIIQYMNALLPAFQPTFMYDLEKYYPKAYKLFTNYQFTDLKNGIVQNIRRGIREGLYRKDVNAEIIARLRIQQIAGTFDPITFPSPMFSNAEVCRQGLLLFIHGLVSDKGLKLVQQYTTKKSLSLNPVKA